MGTYGESPVQRRSDMCTVNTREVDGAMGTQDERTSWSVTNTLVFREAFLHNPEPRAIERSPKGSLHGMLMLEGQAKHQC